MSVVIVLPSATNGPSVSHILHLCVDVSINKTTYSLENLVLHSEKSGIVSDSVDKKRRNIFEL